MAKKLIVRLFNLVYLGAAGFAVAMLATKPLVSIDTEISISKETLTSLTEGMTSSEEETPAAARRMLNTADIVGGLELEENIVIPLQIHLPSFTGYMALSTEERPLFINNVITDTINFTIGKTIPQLLDPFKKAAEKLAKEAAKEVLNGSAVTSDLFNSLGVSDEEKDAFTNAISENSDEIIDEMWNTLTQPKEDGTPTTVDDVVDTLQNEINDVLSDLGKDNSAYEGKSVSDEDMAKTKEEMTDMLQEAGLADDDGNITDMDAALAKLLDSYTKTALTTPDVSYQEVGTNVKFTWDAVENAESYTVKVGSEATQTINVNEYQMAIPADDGTYTIKFKAIAAKDDKTYTDSAAKSVTITVNGGHIVMPSQESAPVKSILKIGPRMADDTSSDELELKLTEFVEDLITSKLSALNVNIDELLHVANATTYVMAGIVGVCALPWVLFMLVTLIRTLRKNKCWTKPWIVFTFALTQVVVGVGLTFGLKYAFPLLQPYASKIPSIGDALGSIKIDIKTLCYWPSIVYLGMIVFTIIYVILAHGAKKDFKAFKRARKSA